MHDGEPALLALPEPEIIGDDDDLPGIRFIPNAKSRCQVDPSRSMGIVIGRTILYHRRTHFHCLHLQPYWTYTPFSIDKIQIGSNRTIIWCLFVRMDPVLENNNTGIECEAIGCEHVLMEGIVAGTSCCEKLCHLRCATVAE